MALEESRYFQFKKLKLPKENCSAGRNFFPWQRDLKHTNK